MAQARLKVEASSPQVDESQSDASLSETAPSQTAASKRDGIPYESLRILKALSSPRKAISSLRRRLVTLDEREIFRLKVGLTRFDPAITQVEEASSNQRTPLLWREAPASFQEVGAELTKSAALFEPVDVSKSTLVMAAPKSGTHLFRNLLNHLCPQAMVSAFITLADHGSRLPLAPKQVVVGHLPFMPETLFATRGTSSVVLMRDPAELLLSLVRASFDPRIDRPDYAFIRSKLTLKESIVFHAKGYEINRVSVTPFHHYMKDYIIDWSSQNKLLIDYSDVMSIVQDTESDLAKRNFSLIAEYFGATVPDNWRERARAAGSRRISATSLPRFSKSEQEDALAYARSIISVYAPGVLDWYRAQMAKRLGAR